MSKRPGVTKMLSKMVQNRLISRNEYWSSEVTFDQWTDNERRIDFVSFKPARAGMSTTPATIELGEFTCYEIKSGMNDFTSGHGLSFYGDTNYIVTTPEFAQELCDKWLVPEGVGLLVPNKTGQALYCKRKPTLTARGGRTRSASELLWNMVKAHGTWNGRVSF